MLRLQTRRSQILESSLLQRLRSSMKDDGPVVALMKERVEELKVRETQSAHREREVVEERNRLIGVIEQQNRLLAAPVPAAKPSVPRRPAAKKAVQAKPAGAKTPLVAKKISVEIADSEVELKRNKKKASPKKAEPPKKAASSAKKPLKKNTKKAP